MRQWADEHERIPRRRAGHSAVVLCDGQVGNGVVELTLIRRKGRKRLIYTVGQGAEGAGLTWTEPEQILAEPARAIELTAEPADVCEQALKVGERWRIDGLGPHEREEHRDVGRDAKRRVGVQAVP